MSIGSKLYLPESIHGFMKINILTKFHYVWIKLCPLECINFLCPRHKMVEGHIEFTLSVCVCLCIPESCPGHNLAVHDGI